MSNFKFLRNHSPKKTFRVASVIGRFDLQENPVNEIFEGEINIPEKWNIGLIVGKSGTGKTTIAKELFSDVYFSGFDYNSDSVLDDMPQEKSVDEICKAFNSVGFSSPPSWLKPYQVLSNGEKMRCDLARCILSDKQLFAFDEFTSVVDRQVAKIGSFAIQKAIRKLDKKFIAITCHHDVEEWLLPDWVFNTDTMTFHVNEEQKKNRPSLKFELFETKDKKQYWKMFSKYHYLSHSHNNAARVFVATLNDEVCAFCSTLIFPHPKLKNTWKEHRTVVFPDYQGIGLGSLISNTVAEILKLEGKSFISTTSSPVLIASRIKDSKWKTTRFGRLKPHNGKSYNQGKKYEGSSNRITASFKYIG